MELDFLKVLEFSYQTSLSEVCCAKYPLPHYLPVPPATAPSSRLTCLEQRRCQEWSTLGETDRQPVAYRISTLLPFPSVTPSQLPIFLLTKDN